MSTVWFIRHGRTDWNEAGLMQGRTDISLNDAGRAALNECPASLKCCALPCFSSPLARARETAIALSLQEPQLVPALIEMDWGDWEGRTLRDLRRELGPSMAVNEDRGLDFRPGGGESPREVGARAKLWLEELPCVIDECVVVTHKGVIRALMAIALGWNMLGSPPVRLRWECAHGFTIGDSGELELAWPNTAVDAVGGIESTRP
jgi:broad specificity phosphatase PhoE